MSIETTVAASRNELTAYRTPRLIDYGRLRTVTQSGTGNAAESQPTPPGGNPDPAKKRTG